MLLHHHKRFGVTTLLGCTLAGVFGFGEAPSERWFRSRICRQTRHTIVLTLDCIHEDLRVHLHQKASADPQPPGPPAPEVDAAPADVVVDASFEAPAEQTVVRRASLAGPPRAPPV